MKGGNDEDDGEDDDEDDDENVSDEDGKDAVTAAINTISITQVPMEGGNDEDDDEDDADDGDTDDALDDNAFTKITTIDNTTTTIITSITAATISLWSGTNKKRDVSTGPLARPFAHSLAPLTSLTPSLVGK